MATITYSKLTPAAPAQRQNVQWQSDGATNPHISANIPLIPSIQGVNNQTGTSYHLALGDSGFLVRMSNAASNTVTVDPDSTTNFNVGTVIWVRQVGAGLTSIVAGAGVTINTQSASLGANAQYALIQLTKVAANTWDLDVHGNASLLQGKPVSSTVSPSGNQVLFYNGTNNDWEPGSISSLPNADAAKINSITVTSNPKEGDTLRYSVDSSKYERQTDWDFFLYTSPAGSTYAIGCAFPFATQSGTSVWTPDGTASSVAGTATELAGFKITCSASAGAIRSAGLRYGGSDLNSCKYGIFRRLRTRLSLGQTTNTRIFIGMFKPTLTAATFNADTPNAEFVAFRYSSNAGDTKYQCICQTDNTHQTIVAESTSSHVDTNSHVFDIIYDGTSYTFYIDDVLVATISTNKPADSDSAVPSVLFDNTVTTSAASFWTWFYWKACVKNSLL